MRTWPLLKLRPLALAYLVLVEAAAAVCLWFALTTSPAPSRDHLVIFALLGGTALIVVVATALFSRIRREMQRSPWIVHVAYLSAGCMALPPNLLALLLIGPLLHGALGPRPDCYRWLFTTSGVALATFLGRAILGWSAPSWEPWGVLIAGAALLVARSLIVAIGLWLMFPSEGGREAIGEPIDALLGIVAVTIGGILGIAISSEPLSALLAAPTLAMLDVASQLPHWRRSAQRDGKTGLANAVHWNLVARGELLRAAGRGNPVAVLLLDLDHFKRINDQVGHLAGDAVLFAVALLLRGNVRRDDVVGRFGGEEFVILLPGADSEIAERAAERVRSATESLSVPVRDTYGQHREVNSLSLSVGLATSDRFGYELSDLLVAADAALLSAKSSGRNAVTVA